MTPTLDRSYIYDGWNVLLEVDLMQAIPEIARGFVWGLDLSQSLQGAGGVGGLLSVIAYDASSSSYTSYIPSYDANGNITEYTDTAGAIVAHYQYDPFGNITTQTGALADEFPHRFSTNYTDDESGLIYYGYRYYNPELGRWINRDPIGELGGVNIYLFVGNNPLRSYDILGLSSSEFGYPLTIFGQEFAYVDCSVDYSCSGGNSTAQCHITGFTGIGWDNLGWNVYSSITSNSDSKDCCTDDGEPGKKTTFKIRVRVWAVLGVLLQHTKTLVDDTFEIECDCVADE